jgi:hypothetical protein
MTQILMLYDTNVIGMIAMILILYGGMIMIPNGSIVLILTLCDTDNTDMITIILIYAV